LVVGVIDGATDDLLQRVALKRHQVLDGRQGPLYRRLRGGGERRQEEAEHEGDEDAKGYGASWSPPAVMDVQGAFYAPHAREGHQNPTSYPPTLISPANV